MPYPWELNLSSDGNWWRNRHIQGLRLPPEEAARERLRDGDTAENDRQKILQGQNNRTQRVFTCPAAGRRPTINAYGQLQVCLQVRHPATLLDLNQESLKTGLTWHFPRMKKLKTQSRSFFQKCAQCALRPACPQCPVVSWMESRTLDEPGEYYCQVMHAQARQLGILFAGQFGWQVKLSN
ncbi:MAG: Radical protein [Candidatus Berkelbacteria bacterium]|nr:Radical protein [Candidatus Berkelbacteria bacterium]